MKGFVILMLITIFCGTLSATAQQVPFVRQLKPVPISAKAVTGEKPQAKVWFHHNSWWAVFPTDRTTCLWQLDGESWVNKLKLDDEVAYADCKPVGDLTHIILYKGRNSELVSLEFQPKEKNYRFWHARPYGKVNIKLDAGVETATLEVDELGRMFIASDGDTVINVRCSDPPYTQWKGPITLATGVSTDDICAVVAMPGKTGVLWSNQQSMQFGFRTITNGKDPSKNENWTQDEEPAIASALDMGLGMSDDHLNVKVAGDGTVYCAVKTSYDSTSFPRIALLVRRQTGVWDSLYTVDAIDGTRPIVLLDEEREKVTVVYTASNGGGNILYKESALSRISFPITASVLIKGNYNNASSTKQTNANQTLVISSNNDVLTGAIFIR